MCVCVYGGGGGGFIVQHLCEEEDGARLADAIPNPTSPALNKPYGFLRT